MSFSLSFSHHSELSQKSASRLKLESWLNKSMKIEMSDGRTLVGVFLCTDKERNVILGSTLEFLKPCGNYSHSHA